MGLDADHSLTPCKSCARRELLRPDAVSGFVYFTVRRMAGVYAWNPAGIGPIFLGAQRTTRCKLAQSAEAGIKQLSFYGNLESVRRLQAGLQSFLSMRRIDARRKNARAFRLRFSQSLASLRQRLSQAMVRSTIQRLGKTTNPLA